MRQLVTLCSTLSVLLIAAACAGGGEEIPRPRVLEEPGTSLPGSAAEHIKAMALQAEDFPEGFVLGYDHAEKQDTGSLYLAHYYNGDASEDDILRGVLSNADVLVALFDDERDAIDFFEVFASMTREDMAAYTQQQRHWPTGEEFEQIQQIGVDAQAVPFRQVGDGALAWQTVERIRFPGFETDVAFYDLSVFIRRGRVVGGVDLGATQHPPDMEDVDALAVLLYQRLGRAEE